MNLPLMKPRLLVLFAALLSVSARLAAEDVVVFSMGDFRIVQPWIDLLPADKAQASFLESAGKDLLKPSHFDVAYPLVNPPAWGRIVRPDSTGRLEILRSYPRGFRFAMNMEHMQPNHTYVLCINGRPEHPGNELLPTAVPGHEAERYYDFYTLTTNANGSYRAGFALMLKPGAYNVHFYIKDTSDHKIVLYGLEYFDFTVR
jgi:hypothetical protein